MIRGARVRTGRSAQLRVVRGVPLEVVARHAWDNRVLAGWKYSVELPDGATRTGALDADGRLRIERTLPGVARLCLSSPYQRSLVWQGIADLDQRGDGSASNPRIALANEAERGLELETGRTTHLLLEGPSPARVLILGDSISKGYWRFVRSLLSCEAAVLRPMGRKDERERDCRGRWVRRAINTKHTGFALNLPAGPPRLRDWLAIAGGGWDVVHFNFGAWDIRRDRPGKRKRTTQADYCTNLGTIVDLLRKTPPAKPDVKLIFATTTPIPQGAKERRNADAKVFNCAAKDVMCARQVPINDLYAYARRKLGRKHRKAPRDVHFTCAGSRALARQVAKHIRDALSELRASRSA